MRKMVCLLTAFLLIGCATTTYSLKPVDKQSNIENIYKNGDAYALSTGTYSKVSLGGLKNAQSEFVFYVGIQNISNTNLDIDPTKISVTAVNKEGTQTLLKVYDPKDYIKGKYAAADSKAVIQALSNGVQAYADASRPTSTTYSSGNAFAYGSRGGYASAYGSGVSQTYNQGYNDLKNSIRGQQLNESIQSDRQFIQMIESKMLKRNTLLPGQQIDGIVMVQCVDEVKYIVTIPVGNDFHRIEMSQG